MIRVLKLLVILSLTLLAFSSSQAQIIPFPSAGSYGIGYHRIAIDSVLYLPTGCGIPSGTASLRSYGFGGQGQKLKMVAIQADTCGHHVYWYSPTDSSWNRLDGSGGGGDDSVLMASKYYVDTAKANIRSQILLKLNISDSNTAYASWGRLYKTIDSMKIVNDGRYKQIADSNKDIHSYASIGRINKLADSLTFLLLQKLDSNQTIHSWASIGRINKIADSLSALFMRTVDSNQSIHSWASIGRINKIADSLSNVYAARFVTNLGGSSGVNRGTFLSRPSPGSAANTYYWSTDSVFYSYSDGSTWKDLKPGTGSSGGTDTTRIGHRGPVWNIYPSAAGDSLIDKGWNNTTGDAYVRTRTDSANNIILKANGVTPGSYTNTNLTVDSTGRITAASNGTAGGSSSPYPLDSVLRVGPISARNMQVAGIKSTGQDTLTATTYSEGYDRVIVQDTATGAGNGKLYRRKMQTVDMTGATTGQIVEYNGTNFDLITKPIADSGFSLQFNNLTGVPLAKVIDGSGHRVIQYDSGFSRPGAFTLNSDLRKAIDSIRALPSGLTIAPQGPIQSFTGTGVDTLAVATEIGTTYNKSSFSSLSDFAQNTGSFTTSSGHIVTGAGTALDTTKYISLPDVGYGNRWIKGYIMIAPTKTSTSPSPQVGVRSLVSTFIASQLGWVDLSTGADAGKTFYQGKGVAAVKSTMALTWTAGDSIMVYTKRFDDTLWVTAINLMAANRNIATLKYVFAASGTASIENKGVTTIWTQGDAVSIVNVFAANHDLKYSNLGVLADSKGQLYNASSFKKVFANQLIDFYGSGVNYGQTGAKMQDLIDEEPDILAHHFKNILIQVGCNEVGSLSTYQTNSVAFYNWAKANGMRPIVMSVTWESARNLDAMYVWQSNPARPWVSDGNWIDDYDITRASNMLAGDGIHLLDHAHDSITTRTIDQAVIPGGVNSLKRPICGNCNAGDVPYTAAAPDMMLASPWSYNGSDSLISKNNVTATFNRIVIAGTGANHAPFFSGLFLGDQTLGPLQYVWVSQAGVMKFLNFTGSTDIYDFNKSGQASYPQNTSSLTLGASAQSTVGLLVNPPSGSRQAIETEGQVYIKSSNVGGPNAGGDAAVYYANRNTGAKEYNTGGDNTGFVLNTPSQAWTWSRTGVLTGVGSVTSPTAQLHFQPQTTSASSAPIKFSASGNTLMTTPENGAFEFDNTDLYITSGGTRKKLGYGTINTVQNNGTPITTGSVINFLGGATYNSGTGAVDVTAGGGSNYQTVQNAGSSITVRPRLNFPSAGGLTAVDNSGNTSSDVSIATIPSATTGTTQAAGDNSLKMATTAYVDGLASSGSYTPTLTNTTNITSSSLNTATYMKIGNKVHVSIDCQLTPTSNSTLSVLTITLPFTTSNSTQLTIGQGGIGYNAGVLYNNGLVQYASSTTVTLRFLSASTLAGNGAIVNISFDYSL